jgi:hypothetical protein
VAICGTVLWTGAAHPVIYNVKFTDHSPDAVPTADELPPMAIKEGATNPATGALFIRTSDSCDMGAIVRISPAEGAEIDAVAKADDGRIAGLVVTLPGPATLTAWIGDTRTGTLPLPPPAPA